MNSKELHFVVFFYEGNEVLCMPFNYFSNEACKINKMFLGSGNQNKFEKALALEKTKQFLIISFVSFSDDKLKLTVSTIEGGEIITVDPCRLKRTEYFETALQETSRFSKLMLFNEQNI